MRVIYKGAGAMVLLVLACAFSGVAAAHAQSVENGVYEVSVQAFQASIDERSMCDGALVNPAKLTVKDGSATLRIELKPVELLGSENYLGVVGYYPDGKEGSAETAKPAQVVSTYANVKDDYNKAKSADNEVRGVEYPKEVELPWDISGDWLLLRVYVPVMNKMVAGNGWQVARLKADYSTLKRVGDVEDAPLDEPDPDPDPVPAPTPAPDPKPDPKPKPSPGPSDGGLDFGKLADGEYTVKGTVLKADRSSASMADAAVSHDVGLTVKDGRYSLTLSLGSVNVGGKAGYLRDLRYYKEGYSVRSGAPAGATGACSVVAYQLSGGKRVSDAFGTDYPAQVTFPLIDEAKGDGLVPLQALVPIMESIAAGTGTQSMYLKLDRDSVSGGAPGPAPDGGTAGGGQSGGSGGSVLAGSTLPTGSGLSAASGSPVKVAAVQQPTAGSGASSNAGAAVAAEDRKPPLQGALVPMAATSGAVAFAGAGSVLFRRRRRLLDWMAGLAS